MEIDFHRTCKYSFLDSAIGDVLRAIDGQSLMGSMILSFCIIDYMAQVISPNWSGTRSHFKNYVTDNLSEINPAYKHLGEEMYAVRNSLIHSYGESDSSKRLDLQFLFATTSFENSHLDIKTIDNEKVIYFDLPKFVSEIVISVISFFEKNQQNNLLFETWYLRKIKTLNLTLFHKGDPKTNSTFPFYKIHNSLTFFNKTHFDDKLAVVNYANLIRKKCCS